MLSRQITTFAVEKNAVVKEALGFQILDFLIAMSAISDECWLSGYIRRDTSLSHKTKALSPIIWDAHRSQDRPCFGLWPARKIGLHRAPVKY